MSYKLVRGIHLFPAFLISVYIFLIPDFDIDENSLVIAVAIEVSPLLGWSDNCKLRYQTYMFPFVNYLYHSGTEYVKLIEHLFMAVLGLINFCQYDFQCPRIAH